MNEPEMHFRNLDEIPMQFRFIFSDYPCFNIIQSKLLNHILHSEKSLVVSAPTGSGKTVIFELAIVKLLHSLVDLQKAHDNFKIIYISPIKSLCQERLEDWQKKFSPCGLNVISITGDSDRMDFSNLGQHNLIISTPEKWDCLTRKWRENEKMVKEVKLFMIDEVHLLNEDSRGSTLEVIVSRMKTVENSLNRRQNDQRIRFMAVSATIPNVEDVAEWMGKPPNVEYFRFSEDVRPVKLTKIVIGYNYNAQTMTPFKFDLSLNYKLQFLMTQYAEGKPTLIFCSTRKSVEMTAKHLVQTVRIQLSPTQSQKLCDISNTIADIKTRDNIKNGIGIHHAGLNPETRHVIEDTFRKGDLPVLVTTSTLAMGVNLPAHLVIIKSTKCYDKGGFRDYSEIAMHQMIGRAGRPQFDTNATVLILTTKDDQEKFEKMIGCNEPVESNLHRHLTEHLNAEIALGTITDLEVAMQWLTSTFLYIRAMKNPRHYGLSVALSKTQIEQKLLEICQIDLNKLVTAGMITMDQNIVITPTNTGKIMARYYVAFETMKLFTQITGTEILMQILAIVSKCQEFSSIHLRTVDKKPLNFLNKPSNKNRIRFPLNGKIKSGDMKVNCVIQAVLGNLSISENSLINESFTIMRNGERITKCLIEYLVSSGKNCYSALLNTIILGKCFHAKLWEDSPFVAKQLSGIGNVLSTHMANAGKTSFEKILESNPRNIEMIIKKKPPFGDYLIEEVQHIPRYDMTLEKTSQNKVMQFKLKIELKNSESIRETSTVDVKSVMTLLVGTNLNKIIVYERYKHSYMIEHCQIMKIFTVDACTELENVEAHFISEDWVGIDCRSAFILQKPTNQTKESTKPTYIQMFLDMYMKIKKPLGKDRKEETASKKTDVNNYSQKITNESNNKMSSKKRNRGEINDDSSKLKNHQTNISNTLIPIDKDMEKFVERVAESNDNFRFMSENLDLMKNSPNNYCDDLMNFHEIENSCENECDQEKKENNTPRSITDFHGETNIKYYETNETGGDDNLLTNFQRSLSFENDENGCNNVNEYSEPDKLSNNHSFSADSDKILKDQNEILELSETLSNGVVYSNSKGLNSLLNTSSVVSDSKSDIISTSEIDVKRSSCSNIPSFIKKTLDAKDVTEEKKSSSIDVDYFIETDPRLLSVRQRYKSDTAQQKSYNSENCNNLKRLNFTMKRNIDIRRNDTSNLQNFISSRKKQKKNISDIHPAEELEDSIFNEEACMKCLGDFKKPEKKKMSHQIDDYSCPDSTVTNLMAETDIQQYKKPKLYDNENILQFNKNKTEQTKKSIKWRSPLVFSPVVKFSPKINISSRSSDEIEIHNDGGNDTLNSSMSSKNSRRAGNLTLNIQRTTKKTNESQHSFSGFKHRGTKFPLCDNDYKSLSKSLLLNEFSEICAPSFLEDLVATTKEILTPKKYSEPKASSATDYYTQFLNQTSAHTEKQHDKQESQKEQTSLSVSFNDNQENIQPIVKNMPKKSGSSQSLFGYQDYNVEGEELPNNKFGCPGDIRISQNGPVQHERESLIFTRPHQEYSDIRGYNNYMPVTSRKELGTSYMQPWSKSDAHYIPPLYASYSYQPSLHNENMYIHNDMNIMEAPQESQKVQASLSVPFNENQENIQPIVENMPNKSCSSQSLFSHQDYNIESEELPNNKFVCPGDIKISQNESVQHERKSSIFTRPQKYGDIRGYNNYMPITSRRELGTSCYMKPWPKSDAHYIPSSYASYSYQPFLPNEHLYIPNDTNPIIEAPRSALRTGLNTCQAEPHTFQSIQARPVDLNQSIYVSSQPTENYHFPPRIPNPVYHFNNDYQSQPANTFMKKYPRQPFSQMKGHDQIYRVPPNEMKTSFVGGDQECDDSRLSQRVMGGSDIFNRSLQENNVGRYMDVFGDELRRRDDMQSSNESLVMRNTWFPSHADYHSHNIQRNLDYHNMSLSDHTGNFTGSSFPTRNNNRQSFYSPNGKDYVMNKFLYSLNQ